MSTDSVVISVTKVSHSRPILPITAQRFLKAESADCHYTRRDAEHFTVVSSLKFMLFLLFQNFFIFMNEKSLAVLLFIVIEIFRIFRTMFLLYLKAQTFI